MKKLFVIMAALLAVQANASEDNIGMKSTIAKCATHFQGFNNLLVEGIDGADKTIESGKALEEVIRTSELVPHKDMNPSAELKATCLGFVAGANLKIIETADTSLNTKIYSCATKFALQSVFDGLENEANLKAWSSNDIPTSNNAKVTVEEKLFCSNMLKGSFFVGLSSALVDGFTKAISELGKNL